MSYPATMCLKLNHETLRRDNICYVYIRKNNSIHENICNSLNILYKSLGANCFFSSFTHHNDLVPGHNPLHSEDMFPKKWWTHSPHCSKEIRPTVHNCSSFLGEMPTNAVSCGLITSKSWAWFRKKWLCMHTPNIRKSSSNKGNWCSRGTLQHPFLEKPSSAYVLLPRYTL